ncbi:MAG: hypothetical protein KKF48_04630 [Nanoarchaeota archaeon]|nr:hypothetical protein [Nanoarchaeota archaeon]MBU1028302.1 hypothetical protein [Nanoarchaeota archaeon]
MHLKRQIIPKSWPIKRKENRYIVRPNFNIQGGMPILVILRDILKLAQNRKEVKKAIHLKQVLLNNKKIRDEKNSALLFDTITILPPKDEKNILKKYYRLGLSEKGKFNLLEIKESEANSKTSKIINKKILKGKKIQLNLSDGKNFIYPNKCDVNDSVLINFKEKSKIEKCLPLKEKSKAIIFAGKHAGEYGVIKKINKETKIAELELKNKKINVLIKQLMVLE